MSVAKNTPGILIPGDGLLKARWGGHVGNIQESLGDLGCQLEVVHFFALS